MNVMFAVRLVFSLALNQMLDQICTIVMHYYQFDWQKRANRYDSDFVFLQSIGLFTSRRFLSRVHVCKNQTSGGNTAILLVAMELMLVNEKMKVFLKIGEVVKHYIYLKFYSDIFETMI